MKKLFLAISSGLLATHAHAEWGEGNEAGEGMERGESSGFGNFFRGFFSEEEDEVMGSIKHAFKPIAQMAEGKRPVDMHLLRIEARKLAIYAQKMRGRYWEHSATQKLIDEDPQRFRQLNENFIQATAKLDREASHAKSLNDIMPTLKKVGRSCKRCHEDFKPQKKGFFGG